MTICVVRSEAITHFGGAATGMPCGSGVALIRSRGHLPEEEYDGHDGGYVGQTDPAQLHRRLQDRAVRLVLDEGKTVAAAARDLGLTESSLRNWVEQCDLRHEAGSRFDEAGVPISYTSKILGHTNLNTTSRYLNRSTDGARETRGLGSPHSDRPTGA